MPLDTAKATVVLRDLTAKFDTAVKSAKLYYPNLCTVVTSDGADEKYGWLGSMPTVREWLGARRFNELRAANYVLANKHWEDSLRIAKNDIKDDRHGMYAPVMNELGLRAAKHPDKLLFQALVAGASSVCFDGQYFFDTDHAWGDSGTQSNKLTYNATDHTAVTESEFLAAFEAALVAMLGFKDDNGEPFTQPVIGESELDGLRVTVPLGLWKVAKKAVEAVVINNTTNVKLANPVVECAPFLTDNTKFYTFHTNSYLKPFVFQAREPLSRQTKGLDDAEEKDVKFMTEARYNVGYLAWWNAVETTFN